MERLENEKYIYDHDPSHILDILFNFPKQFKQAEASIQDVNFNLRQDYKNALVVGIGNSAFLAHMLLEAIDINRINIPIVFSSKNTVPSWVDKDTLVIALSHSGETLEVLDAVGKVLKQGIRVIAITAGGKLKQLANQEEEMLLIEYKTNIKSRMAIGYMYALLVNTLNRTNALDICFTKEACVLGIDWDQIENSLFECIREFSPDVKIYKNLAKKTALNLYKHIPIIYGGTPVANAICCRLKSQLCVNSKNFAHFYSIPELDHDEIAAWEMRSELRDRFFILFISDNEEREEIRKRIEIFKGMLFEKRLNFEEITLRGENKALKAFYGIYLADWISIYLAVLNEVDPSSRNLIDQMKHRLHQSLGSGS